MDGRSWRRAGAISVGVALLGGLIFWGTRGSGSSKDKGAYETATVDRGSVVSRVTASGTLSALVTVQVGAQVSGRLQTINVDFNDPVHKGEVLARLDPQLYQAALDAATANDTAARADLAHARALAEDAAATAERAKSLLAQGALGQAEADSDASAAKAAASEVDSARAKTEQTHAALQQAQVNLGYTTILSPIDGVVISRSVDVGQTVAASLSAPTLFLLAEDLSHMDVDTSVAESDIGKLTPHMDASFTVDAFPDAPFSGTVRQIRNAAQTVQNVVTYDAVVDVENPKGLLRPGMTANVTFVIAKRDDVLRIPNTALRYRAPPELQAKVALSKDPGKRTVWRLKNGQPEPVSVSLGVTDGRTTEVLSGDLAVGDTLITYSPDADTKPAGATAPPGGGSSAFRRPF